MLVRIPYCSLIEEEKRLIINELGAGDRNASLLAQLAIGGGDGEYKVGVGFEDLTPPRDRRAEAASYLTAGHGAIAELAGKIELDNILRRVGTAVELAIYPGFDESFARREAVARTDARCIDHRITPDTLNVSGVTLFKGKSAE